MPASTLGRIERFLAPTRRASRGAFISTLAILVAFTFFAIAAVAPAHALAQDDDPPETQPDTGDGDTGDGDADTGDGDGDADTGDGDGDADTGDGDADADTTGPGYIPPMGDPVPPAPKRRMNSQFRVRFLARPLPFVRNTGLDFLANFPGFESTETLPAGSLGFGIRFDMSFLKLAGTSGEFIEIPVHLDYALAEGLELRVEGRGSSWNGSINGATLNLDPGVGTTLSFAISDLVVGVKYQPISPAHGDFGLALRVQFKLPLGDNQDFVTNNDYDLNAALLLMYEFKWFRLFGMLGGTVMFGGGENVFTAGNGITEDFYLSGAGGIAVPVTWQVAIIIQTDFHIAYLGNENTWTVDMGTRIDLGDIGTPWYLYGGFSFVIMGDGRFSALIGTEILFEIDPLFG